MGPPRKLWASHGRAPRKPGGGKGEKGGEGGKGGKGGIRRMDHALSRRMALGHGSDAASLYFEKAHAWASPGSDTVCITALRDGRWLGAPRCRGRKRRKHPNGHLHTYQHALRAARSSSRCHGHLHQYALAPPPAGNYTNVHPQLHIKQQRFKAFIKKHLIARVHCTFSSPHSCFVQHSRKIMQKSAF